MDDHLRPVRVQQVGGDERFIRYYLRDWLGQYFTGSGWSDEPAEAALYYRTVDAVEAHSRFYLEGGQPVETFTAKVVVRTVMGEWTVAELMEHLRQWGVFIMRSCGEQRGVVVEIEWDELAQEER